MTSIPSSHVNALTTGSGPVRTIKRGSSEWLRIVSELRGDPETFDAKCAHCARAFTYKAHAASVGAVFCGDHCAHAHACVSRSQCPTCEAPVEKTVHNRKYCSKKCFYKWHDIKRRGKRLPLKTKVCDHCRAPFIVKREGGKPQRFCKAHCRIRWWRAKESAERKSRALGRTCALQGCDNTFDRDSRSSQKYCCDTCFKESRRRSMRRRRGKPETPDYATPLLCTICQETFSVRPQNRTNARTCYKKTCKAQRRKQKRLLKKRTHSSKSASQDGV